MTTPTTITVQLSNNRSTLEDVACNCIEFAATITNNDGSAATVDAMVVFPQAAFDVCSQGDFGTPSTFIEPNSGIIYTSMQLISNFAANETRVLTFSIRIREDALGFSGQGEVSLSAGVLGVSGSGDGTSNQINLGDFRLVEGVVNVSEAQASQSNPGAPLIPLCCDINSGSCTMNKLIIDGELVVDEDYCFLGSGSHGNILMREDAKITILSGQRLLIKDVIIRGCDEMWQAIEVMPGGELVLIDCVIQDGYQAIKAWAGSTINITSTKFKNNRFGLYALSPEGTFGAVNVTRFYKNTFLTEGELLPPFEGQKGEAGIYTGDVSAIDISAPDRYLKNHFLNLANGIIIENSNVVCKYNSFEDIVTLSPGDYKFSGYAIHTVTQPDYTRVLEQKGLGNDPEVYDATFEDCTHGLYTDGTRLTSNGNYMTGMVYGFESQKSRRVTITDNTIECEQAGISMFQNAPCIASIMDNTVIVDESGTLPDAIGIRLDENFIQYDNRAGYKVQNNLVSLHNARTGIQLTSGRFIDFVNNWVGMFDNVEYDGIRLLGTRDALVSCNEVVGPLGTSFTATKGIFVANSPYANVACNALDDTELGVHFFGLNENNLLRGNEFGSHYFGLQLGAYDALGSPIDASIGVQIHHGNRWTVAAPSAGVQALHVSSDLDIILQSIFRVNDNDDADFLPTN